MSEGPKPVESPAQDEAEPRGSAGRGRAIAGVVVLGILLVLSLVVARTGELERSVGTMIEWAQGAGAAGIVGMAAAYVGCVVALLPTFPLTMGAGLVWGPVRAALVVIPIATLGCTLAFLSGRYLFRDLVEARISQDPRFVALDRAIEAQGFWLVLLLRLSPAFPYNVLNYSLGITRVRLGPYVLGSMLGMIPITFVWAHLGATAGQLSMQADAPASTETQIARLLSLLATITVTVFVTRLARRALKSAVETPVEAPAETPED